MQGFVYCNSGFHHLLRIALGKEVDIMNCNQEQQYLDLCRKILEEGVFKQDRTGTGTYSIFGYQMRFDLSKTFPLLTTKSVPLRIVAEELFWFLKGATNIQELVQKKVHIWDDWPFEKWFNSEDYDGEHYVADWKEKRIKDLDFQAIIEIEKKRFASKIASDDEFAAKWGELGPVYGKQWRNWEGANGETIDQIVNVLNGIMNDPDSRRLIVSGWKADEINQMALPPCHTLFQFYVANGKLSCQLYQRSADAFLGSPFNIASYALKTKMIAQVVGLEVGEFIYTLGDAHIYANHVDQVREQLTRTPYELPTLTLNPDVKDLFDFKWEDITLHNYQKHPAIKAPIAI